MIGGVNPFRRLLGITSKDSARNGFWIIFERLISVGIATVIMIFSARYLGVENYGILTYGLAVVTLFSGVMKLGLDSIMVNELIDHKDKEGSFLGTSIILRLISSIASIAALFIILSVLNPGDWIIITVALVQAAILIFQSLYVLDFWFQSKLKSKYVSIAKITASIVMASYSAYLLLTGKDLIWFAASTSLVGFVVGVILLVFYLCQSDSRLTVSLKDAKYLLSKSHHFIIASIISTIYVQIDRLMIGNMLDQTQLGLYSAGMMLCNAWIFLPDSIITSLRPGIIHAKAKNEEVYSYKLKRLYFMVFWLSASAATLITLSAPLLVPLLFGNAFNGAVLVTQIAVWYVPFSMLGMARSIWTVSENNHKYPKYYLIHGLILNVALNLILIPQLGIVGAAVSTIVTELFTCFVSPMFYKRTRPHTKIVLDAIFYRLNSHKEI